MNNNNSFSKNLNSPTLEDVKNTLKPSSNLRDFTFNSKGLYSKEDIDDARFNKYSRFGRVLDPYGRLNPGREYLFFVKPDLHICMPSGTSYTIDKNGNKIASSSAKNDVYTISGAGNPVYENNSLRLNPQMSNNLYFRGLIDTHPRVLRQLQTSLGDYNPFANLLSFSVASNLSLDGSSANTLQTPSTILGTKYNYLLDSEASDEEYSFSLEFLDNKNLDTYHFFKAYSEYHIERKSGLVTPPTLDYYRYKRLHNTMGIYKFIVGEDMETIIYWAYLWGVIPMSCPRDAFSDPGFSDGLDFSIQFSAAFIEDMNPLILYQFNKLMGPYLKSKGIKSFTKDYMPVVKEVKSSSFSKPDLSGVIYPGITDYKYIDGTLPIGAYVDGRRINNEKDLKYRLRWYADPGVVQDSYI